MFHENGGTEHWIGTHSFNNDYCQNFVRLYPNPEAGVHIENLIDDAYFGPQRDFTWEDLAPNAPDTVLNSDTSEEDGTGKGTASFFFATEEEPPLLWVQQIAITHPLLNIVYDYQRESTELLGRVMFSGGRIYKSAHLTQTSELGAMKNLDASLCRQSHPSSGKGKKIEGRTPLTLVKD